MRLDLDKLVTRRKGEVKDEAISRARRALEAHIATLNAEIAPMRLPAAAAVADFAGAIKGKRLIDSMQDALEQVLTGAKINADAAARTVRANITAFEALAEGMHFLFADLSALIHKPAEDFALLVQGRIATHRAAEAERERKRKEAEEDRIAAEAKRLAAQQIEDARLAALAEQRRQDAAADSVRIAAQAQDTERLGSQQVLKAEPARTDATDRETPANTRPRGGAMGAGQAAAAAPVGVPRPDEPATVLLGAICARLGFEVSARFLSDALHVSPARTDKAAKLYTESQFQTICSQLRRHVGAMAEL